MCKCHCFSVFIYKYELWKSCVILRQAENQSQKTTSGERFVFFPARCVVARNRLICRGRNNGEGNEKKLDFTHLGVWETEARAPFRKQKRFEDIDLVAIADKEACLCGRWHASWSIHIFFVKWYIHIGTRWWITGNIKYDNRQVFNVFQEHNLCSSFQ